jgi:photosystem II stability/assembly factor-like uncharacterized protein
MKKSILLLSALIINQLSAQNPEIKPNDGARTVNFGSIRARAIGPAVMSGRVSDVDGVASKPEIIYVGGANGGVWKSNSAGANFRPVFDDYQQAIGKIRIDQTHPDTVWVGTGEPWVRNSVGVGTGIYVSKNGGSTWEFKGLKNSERIAGIEINPKNSNEIFVGVQGALWSDSPERGVFKSADFGKTWEKILYVDEKTGCADLAMNPQDPSVMFAAMWDHRRRPDFFNSGGAGSALYKTTDGGKNWTKVTGGGFPTSTLGRIAVAIAPSNPKVIYATVECQKKEEKGLYKSTDGGATWKWINADFNVTVRPFYFSRLNVDPNDEKTVIKAGLQAAISNDGGVTFRNIQSGVHSDMHAFWFNPKNSKNIVIGTDGGAYISHDGGYLFKMCNDLPLSQFYHISVDDETPYNIYGGLQDNNSWYGPNESVGGVKNQDWMPTTGGDGFYAFRHPANKNIIFSESQGGDLARYDKSNGLTKDIKPLAKQGEPEYRWNWNAPIALSPTNPNRMYFACQFLFRTDDMGDTWTKISPDLTTNDVKRQDKKTGGFSPDWSGAETNTTIVQIAESPLDGNMIWCGTDDGNLQLTTNGGKTWTNLAKNINAPAGLWVSHIEPSRFDKNTCYVTIDGHRSGDQKPYVFRTTDGGKSFLSLNTEGVESYLHCITEDVVNRELLFLGSEMGLYISIDGGKSFKHFKNNIPKTAVMKMVVHPKELDLVIGTHGRGVFIIDDLNPLRALSREIAEKEFHLFEVKPKIYNFRKPISSGFYGAGNFYGENAESNIQVTFYQKKRHASGDFKVELYDQAGKLMQSVPAPKSLGINIVDLQSAFPPAKLPPTSNYEALFRGILPPRLPEGNYSVKITKGDQIMTAPLVIKFSDDCPFPAADRKVQQDAAMKVYNLSNELGYYFYQNKSLHEQAEKAATGLTDAALAKQLTDFATDLKKYNASITTLDGDFYVASGESLREEMAKNYYAIVGFVGKPSAAHLEKLTYLTGEVAKVKTKFDGFIATMNKLNEGLTKATKQPLKVRTMTEFLEK